MTLLLLITGDGGDTIVEWPIYDLEPSSDEAYLFNQAQVSSADGTGTGYAEDTDSVYAYGPRTLTKSLLTGFNEAQAAAEWYVARYATPDVRFTSAVLNGLSEPSTLWPEILSMTNSRRYTYRLRPLGVGTLEKDEFVERISMTIGNGTWLTKLSLSPFGDETPWPLDDANYDLGTNTYPTW